MVEIEDEEQQQRRERYDGAERCLRLAVLDARPAGAAITDQHGDGRADELQRKNVEPRQEADEHADQKFRHDARNEHRRPAVGEGINLVPQEHEQAAGGGKRDEEPDLDRHAHAGQAGHDEEAGADTTEGEERCDDRAFDGSRHEIVPRMRSSTPLAISTWESTGSVGNSRSTIMRT